MPCASLDSNPARINKEEYVSSKRKRGTKTSAFGSAGRINHDSSPFYASRMYSDQPQEEPETFLEVPVPDEFIDCILPRSSQDMSNLPDDCVHLMVTSPPYNARKEYDENLSLEEYRQLLHNVFQETYRVLVTGGRACVNIANLGRKPYLPLHAMLIAEMLELGFLMRGEIIWDKAASAATSTAWGSWLSAANPVLRDVHEYILIFSKGSYRRKAEAKESTIGKEDFLEWTKSVWTFPAASARQIGHPAPFPLELPRRLIELYTFKDDVVLDPFAGSGTTCLAARDLGRRYIGYEINSEYHRLALKRLAREPAGNG
jgi:DNA modification methylase